VGVARGYHRRPAATAERFLPDPFADEPGARIYRTGDLTQWLPGGGARFLGRVDEQAKVRGHRIELGEIRAELCAQPEVGDAAVVVLDASTPAARLVGYVVMEPTVATAPSPSELRNRLSARLPAAMVPHALVVLPRLPLTPNGKIDRDALPEPRREPAGEDYAAPVTDVERLLAEAMGAVLNVPRVGREDNFFELGGDSMHAMDVAVRSRRSGVDITAQQVLHCQTVAELAGAVAAAEDAAPAKRRPSGQVDEDTINQLLDRIR
jgi:aryl carrier-like protein